MDSKLNDDIYKSPKHHICFSMESKVSGLPVKVGIGDKSNQFYKDKYFSILEAKNKGGLSSTMLCSIAQELDDLFTNNSQCQESFFDLYLGHGHVWKLINIDRDFASSDHMKLIRKTIAEYKAKVLDGSLDTHKKPEYYQDNKFSTKSR